MSESIKICLFVVISTMETRVNIFMVCSFITVRVNFTNLYIVQLNDPVLWN